MGLADVYVPEGFKVVASDVGYNVVPLEADGEAIPLETFADIQEAEAVAIAAARAALEEGDAERAALRQEALGKLILLGLTTEEAMAIIGGGA